MPMNTGSRYDYDAVEEKTGGDAEMHAAIHMGPLTVVFCDFMRCMILA